MRELAAARRFPMLYRCSPLRSSMRVAALVSRATAGCSTPNVSGNTNVTCQTASAATARPAAWRGTVFTIEMENHSYGDIVGNKDAPYLNPLISQGALAAGYHDSYVHPSEPNNIRKDAGET